MAKPRPDPARAVNQVWKHPPWGWGGGLPPSRPSSDLWAHPPLPYHFFQPPTPNSYAITLSLGNVPGFDRSTDPVRLHGFDRPCLGLEGQVHGHPDGSQWPCAQHEEDPGVTSSGLGPPSSLGTGIWNRGFGSAFGPFLHAHEGPQAFGSTGFPL